MRFTRPLLAAAIATACLLPAAASADPGDNGRRGVPNGHLPPPGECRVWIDGVPPGQQAAPTDCRTARQTAYFYGGRVIEGGREGRDDYYRPRERYDRDVYYPRNPPYPRCDEWDYRRGVC